MLNAVSGASQILSQPLNVDDQSQQRRLWAGVQQENLQQAPQNDAPQNAMNTTQANAQEAAQRPQNTQENPATTNEQPANYAQNAQPAPGSDTRGSVIDLLV